MIDPASLLRLMAWLSPAFPTGGFAYSHGLEWAVEAGDVRDPGSLRDWVDAVLTHGAGRSDAILLRHAYRCWADAEAIAEVTELGCAAVAGRERRMESLAQGSAFIDAAAPWRAALPSPRRSPSRGEGDVPYPVAVGALAGANKLPEDATALAYLHAFTANLISAAVRLIPLGQSAGVAVLADLHPAIEQVAAETRLVTLDDIGGCVFRADLASIRHETQYTRLFRS